MQADNGNDCIRRVDISSGVTTTLAGRKKIVVVDQNLLRADGIGSNALFGQPTSLARVPSPSGSSLLVLIVGRCVLGTMA
jgi:hypothetical protein